MIKNNVIHWIDGGPKCICDMSLGQTTHSGKVVQKDMSVVADNPEPQQSFNRVLEGDHRRV